MATVTKVPRASGYAWRARIRDEFGKDRITQTFSRKKDALEWAARIERDEDQRRIHGDQIARTMTLAELIRDYVEGKGDIGAATVINLGWWKREYGKLKCININQTLVREALKRLKAGKAHRGNGKKGIKATQRPRSPATINRYKASLSAAFQHGKEEYDLPENPCRHVKGRNKGKGRVRFLSDDECKELMAA